MEGEMEDDWHINLAHLAHMLEAGDPRIVCTVSGSGEGVMTDEAIAELSALLDDSVRGWNPLMLREAAWKVVRASRPQVKGRTCPECAGLGFGSELSMCPRCGGAGEL